NCTICTMAHMLLFDSSLPNSMWAEAATHTIHTKNCMPHSALNGETPLGRLLGKKPDVGHLRPFGAPVYVFIPEEEHPVRSKLLPHAVEGFLVVYGEASNKYRFLILSKHRVIIS